jgi:hypothetical protein
MFPPGIQTLDLVSLRAASDDVICMFPCCFIAALLAKLVIAVLDAVVCARADDPMTMFTGSQSNQYLARSAVPSGHSDASTSEFACCNRCCCFFLCII